MAMLTVQGVCTGVGATTVAANLAVAITAQEQSTLIIECDSKNLVSSYLGKSESDTKGWASSFSQSGDWREGLFESPEQVHFLPFGQAFLEPEVVEKTVADIISQSMNRYEYIIVLLDSNCHYDSIVDKSDLNLKVAVPTPSCMTLLFRQLDNIDPENTRVILNQYHPEFSISRDISLVMKDVLKARLLSSYVYFDIAVQEAQANLSNPLLLASESAVNREFSQLVAVILSQIEQRSRQR